jgi:restriction endonuclease Mrr
MALPKPQIVANWVVEDGTNIAYQKLENIVLAILRNRISTISEEACWDYIEEFIEDIANDLFRKENDSQVDAVELHFDISDEDDNYYIKFIDTPEIQFLRTLQKDTPENFEIFCKDLLNKLGGNSNVQGGQNDGGVDFISYDLMLNNLRNQSTKGSRIAVIGQAKRYSDGNPVKIKELREFVGASIKKIDELKKTRSEQIGIMNPIILAFWTTSDFHEAAKEYAKDIGIWYLSGVALSQLALSVGMNE